MKRFKFAVWVLVLVMLCGMLTGCFKRTQKPDPSTEPQNNAGAEASLSVSPENVELAVGNTAQFVVVYSGDKSLTWKSSDAAVVDFEMPAVIKAVGAGTATVTVSDGTVSAEATVTVKSGEAETKPDDGEKGEMGIVVNCASLAVRKTASYLGEEVTTLKTGDSVEVFERVTAEGVEWGRVKDGWVCMTYIKTEGAVKPENPENNTSDPTEPKPNETVVAKGTVTSDTLNIRSSANGSEKVGTLYRDDRVAIYEITSVSGTRWGRIDRGWICLSYVHLDGEADKPQNGGTINDPAPEKPKPVTPSMKVVEAKATVTSDTLNVRDAAGIDGKKVGGLKKGDKITVYARTVVGKQTWGYIGTGWCCLDGYTALDTSAVVAKGTVTGTDTLNIRKEPSKNSDNLGSLNKDAAVSVYEVTKVGEVYWGHIKDTGWVCMSYVKQDAATVDSAKIDLVDITGQVNATELNLRKTAGMSGVILGTVKKGETVTIYEKTTVDGLEWGHIRDKGWVAMKYITPVSSEPVKITGHPLTKTVAAGSDAMFGCLAEGVGLTYQWQYKLGDGEWTNTILSGCTTNMLTVPATAERNGCQYRCIVKDSLGNTVTSNPATLTVG